MSCYHFVILIIMLQLVPCDAVALILLVFLRPLSVTFPSEKTGDKRLVKKEEERRRLWEKERKAVLPFANAQGRKIEGTAAAEAIKRREGARKENVQYILLHIYTQVCDAKGRNGAREWNAFVREKFLSLSSRPSSSQ